MSKSGMSIHSIESFNETEEINLLSSVLEAKHSANCHNSYLKKLSTLLTQPQFIFCLDFSAMLIPNMGKG